MRSCKKFRRHFPFVPTFVLTPLTYLGGVFYSVHALPNFGRVSRSQIRFFIMVNGFSVWLPRLLRCKFCGSRLGYFLFFRLRCLLRIGIYSKLAAAYAARNT